MTLFTPVFAGEVELHGCCTQLEDVAIISAQAACLVARETLGPSQGSSSASLDGITWGNPKPDLSSGATREESSQWVFNNWFPVADFRQIFFLLKIFTAIKWQTKPVSKGKQFGRWMQKKDANTHHKLQGGTSLFFKSGTQTPRPHFTQHVPHQINHHNNKPQRNGPPRGKGN